MVTPGISDGRGFEIVSGDLKLPGTLGLPPDQEAGNATMTAVSAPRRHRSQLQGDRPWQR
jgi:hypothetical protein